MRERERKQRCEETLRGTFEGLETLHSTARVGSQPWRGAGLAGEEGHESSCLGLSCWVDKPWSEPWGRGGRKPSWASICHVVRSCTT